MSIIYRKRLENNIQPLMEATVIEIPILIFKIVKNTPIIIRNSEFSLIRIYNFSLLVTCKGIIIAIVEDIERTFSCQSYLEDNFR